MREPLDDWDPRESDRNMEIAIDVVWGAVAVVLLWVLWRAS